MFSENSWISINCSRHILNRVFSQIQHSFSCLMSLCKPVNCLLQFWLLQFFWHVCICLVRTTWTEAPGTVFTFEWTCMKLHMVVKLYIHHKWLVTVHTVECPHIHVNEIMISQCYACRWRLHHRCCNCMVFHQYGQANEHSETSSYRIYSPRISHMAFLTCVSPLMTFHFKCVCELFITVCTCIRFDLAQYSLPYDGVCIHVASERVSHPGYKEQTLHGFLQSMGPCLLHANPGGNNWRNFWWKNISVTRDISVAKILDPAKQT